MLSKKMDKAKKVWDFIKCEEVLGVPVRSRMYKVSLELEKWQDAKLSDERTYHIFKIEKAYDSKQLKKINELIEYRRSKSLQEE